jgi:outer membrane protein TolC
MNTFTQKIFLTTLFGLIFIFSDAQVNLSLEQCRNMALQQSEDIQIAGKTIVKADTEKAVARSYYFPSVSGMAMGFSMWDDIKSDLYLPTVTPDLATGQLVPNIMVDPAGQPIIGPDGNPIFNMYSWLPLEISLKGAYVAGVSVNQPLYTGGKISAGNKMAEIGREMADLNLEIQKMNILAEADQTYWLYVAVNEKVKLAEKAVEMLTRLLEKVKNAYETGMVHQLALSKVQVQLNKAALDLQKARNGHELTQMSLCRVTGLNFDTTIVVTDSLIAYSPLILQQTVTEDISARPEFKAMQKGIELEKQNIRHVKSDYLPTLGISAGYYYFGGMEVNGTSQGNGYETVLAALKIPLFSWGQGKNKINSATTSKEIKELELDKNRKLLQLQVEQARLNLQDAMMRIEISEKALKQSDENLRISNDNYELGFETITDLLMARLEWQKTYSDLIDAKTDFKIKETTYLKVTGRLGIEEHNH